MQVIFERPLRRYIAIGIILIILPLNAHSAFESLSRQPHDFLVDLTKYGRKYGVTLLRTELYGLQELAVNKIGVYGIGESASWRAEFQSTGDEIYREQRFSVEVRIDRIKNIGFVLISDLYSIYIKDYGSVTAPGLGLRVDWRLRTDFTLSGGADGLLTTEIREGQRDIRRLNWCRIDWKIGDNSLLMLLLDKPEGQRAGFSLGYGQNIFEQLGMRLLLSDYPTRMGGGIFIKLGLLTVNLTVLHVYPLGWSQQAGIGFAW